MIPDVINATFQGLGGLVLVLNIRCILRDKIVRGMDWRTLAFFTSWGAWNLYYYPHLDQWFSFVTGVLLFCANAVYLTLIIHYVNRERDRDDYQATGS